MENVLYKQAVPRNEKVAETKHRRKIVKTNHINFAIQSNVVHVNIENQVLDGRIIHVNNSPLVNFASCSYLGLEHDFRIKSEVILAVQRFGSQFSASRSYLSVTLYREIEEYLEDIFQRPVILTPTLTLGHQSSIPLLVDNNDAVILDRQAHNSIQSACNPLRLRGCHIETIEHNRVDQLEERINELKDDYKRIWYLCDGVYSMYGDFAPVYDLKYLLNKYEQFYLYVDDAHGASWQGKNGEGYAYSEIEDHSRLFATISLSKSFASAGGVLTFPNKEMKDKVRALGETMIFSGPIQPPMLGALLASLNIHISDELKQLQNNLYEKIVYFNQQAKKQHLNLANYLISPIRFIPIGDEKTTIKLVQRLMQLGFYVSVAVYPAVPINQAGLRVTITNHIKKKDIDNFIHILMHEMVLCDTN